jgi:hypothetical protein
MYVCVQVHLDERAYARLGTYRPGAYCQPLLGKVKQYERERDRECEREREGGREGGREGDVQVGELEHEREGVL